MHQLIIEAPARKHSHAATLADSPRLMLLQIYLSDGEPHTTAELQERTGSCAIHSDIHELRQNGLSIGPARYVGKSESGRKVYEYRLAAQAAQVLASGRPGD